MVALAAPAHNMRWTSWTILVIELRTVDTGASYVLRWRVWELTHLGRGGLAVGSSKYSKFCSDNIRRRNINIYSE
eukprot:1179488-Prorocentrum_minimum.AAC.3